MKLLITLFLAMALFASCGKLQRSLTSWTGDFTYKCSKARTTYVQSDSGIAVLLDRDGKPVPCR